MEKEPILHQDITDTPLSTGHFSFHLYPFKTLPLLKSHIHPKFVIFNAGAKLADLATADISKLVENFPGLSSVITIYDAWIRKLGQNQLNDPSFNLPKGDDTQSGRPHSKKRKAPARRTKFRSYPKKQKVPAVPGSKRSKLEPKRKVLSKLTLSSQLLGEAAWTDARIRKWVPKPRKSSKSAVAQASSASSLPTSIYCTA